MQYQPAEDVNTVLKELVAKHHPGLTNTRLEGAFALDVLTNKGEEVMCKPKKVSGSVLLFCVPDGASPEPFLAFEVSKALWDKATPEARRGNLDIYLQTIYLNSQGEPALGAITMETYTVIVKRWGMFDIALKSIFEALRYAPETFEAQTSFEFDGEARPAATPENTPAPEAIESAARLFASEVAAQLAGNQVAGLIPTVAGYLPDGRTIDAEFSEVEEGADA